MTVSVESERHLHHPRIYIPDSTNIVSLYTLSNLSRTHGDEFHLYFQVDENADLVKKICPRAIGHSGPVAKGMERSVLFLRPEMNEEELRGPLEGYHRFVLIISVAGAEDPTKFPFAQSYTKLEQAAKLIGYESYCILRLPPIYQNLNLVPLNELEFIDELFFGIDAEDVGSAIGHILSDPELHRGEEYTIQSPSGISPSTLKTVHPQLPTTPGRPIQSLNYLIESIKASGIIGRDRNDFAKITGGEEMTSFEEFLRRTNHSLFHQRFILRQQQEEEE